jgi:hypothetical protein
MSDVKISQFPYVGNTGYTPNDLFVFVNYLNPTGTTSNTKIDDFKNFIIIDSYDYFLPLSGGSVTGSTTFTNGLTANTISATTYQNLPKDIFVTGGTYSNGSTTFINNTGGTFTITGFSTTTPFTGGTVSGATNFTNGLTANTISATTYQNLPVDPDTFVTGFTYGNNVFTIKQNNGQPDLTATINSVTGLTVNGNLNVTGNTSLQGLTATTISATTIYVSPGGANGIVQTITGLNTNNTNPENPVINISVDGVSITGDGTPANPLVSSNPNINLPSCKININGTTGLSNTNNGVLFLSLFNNTVYNTSPSNFVITNSKIQIVNNGKYLILGRYSSYDMSDGTDFLSIGVLSATTSGNLDLGTTIEYLDKGYIGTTTNGEASKSGSMVYVASGGEWIGLNALHGGASGGSGTQGYPVFDNSLFNQPYLEIIKIS